MCSFVWLKYVVLIEEKQAGLFFFSCMIEYNIAFQWQLLDEKFQNYFLLTVSPI